MRRAARATQALAAWGLRVQRLQGVSRGHAEVWRVWPHPPAADLALRVYPPEAGTADALDAELRLLLAAADAGLHVPRPLATTDGRWRVPQVDGTQAVLLQWLHGRQLWAGLRPLHLRQLGVFIARLHEVSSALIQQGAGPSRAAWGPDLAQLAKGPERLRQWCGAGVQRAVARAASRLQQQLAQEPADPLHRGWIHGDLHPWNLLFQRGRAGAIDFSDGGWGFLAQDLASALQFVHHPLDDGVDHRAQAARFEAALLDGYASVRTLPPGWAAQLPMLGRLRMLSTVQWMLSDWPAPTASTWGPGWLQALPGWLDEDGG
ncbi:MAG: hypothetical protein RJA10_2633 [Pseudomonadota bacterium]|jgi:Ser/Thr protein kinase RdoA (MazF antagonist)